VNVQIVFYDVTVWIFKERFDEIIQTITVGIHCLSGLGISIIPELFFELPGVVTASLKPKLYREIGLGVRSRQSTAPATKAFITTAQSWLITNGCENQKQ